MGAQFTLRRIAEALGVAIGPRAVLVAELLAQNDGRMVCALERRAAGLVGRLHA